MGRVGTLALTAVLVVLGAATVGAAVASAAHPVRHGRYVDTDFALSVDLRVAADGRSFAPRRSIVSYVGETPCELDFHVGRPGARARIGPRGRFAFVRRKDRIQVRVTGHFETRNTADLTFGYRRLKGASHACDTSGRAEIRPRRIHRIPFRGCRAQKGPTVLATPSGRVFHQPRWDERDGWITVAFACSYAANKRVEIGQDNDDDSDFGPFRLVGHNVAYQRANCPMGCSFFVQVRDLRDGTYVHDVDAFKETFGRVTDLELKPNGSIAWIARGLSQYEAPPPFTPIPRSVWVDDAAGVRRLDAGDGIDLRSLSLTGSTLTWLNASVPHTAPIN